MLLYMTFWGKGNREEDFERLKWYCFLMKFFLCEEKKLSNFPQCLKNNE